MAELDPEIQMPMFELATQGIESFVAELGSFTPFALATLNDGEIQILETSGEFLNVESAQAGLVEHLCSLRSQIRWNSCEVTHVCSNKRLQPTLGNPRAAEARR